MGGIRCDTTSWMPNGILAGIATFGLLGSQMAATGTDGASYLYNDVIENNLQNEQVSGRIKSVPAGGTLWADEDGSFTYQGPSGVATYELYVGPILQGEGTITLNMTGGGNAAPIGTPDTISTPYNTPVTINVLANDSDPDGSLDPTSMLIASAGSKGTATPNGNGTITYTPNNGATAQDIFYYQVADNNGVYSAPIPVTVTIGAAPPAAPTFAGPAIANLSGTVGVAFSLDVSGRFAGAGLTFGKAGTWPAGLSVSPAGVITGTPSAAVNASGLTVTTSNSGGSVSSNAFGFTIAAAPAPLTGSLTVDAFSSGTGAGTLKNTPIYWTFFPQWRVGDPLPSGVVSGTGTLTGAGILVITSGLPSATAGELRVSWRVDSNPANDRTFGCWLTTS